MVECTSRDIIAVCVFLIVAIPFSTVLFTQTSTLTGSIGVMASLIPVIFIFGSLFLIIKAFRE